MKRVLIFSLAYYPHVGGAEIAIKEITERLSRDGTFEFHMITQRFDRRLEKTDTLGGVVIHRVGSGSSYFSKIFFIPRAAFAAIKLNRKFHFDGAWAMMSYMLFPLMLMRLCGVRLPYVLTLQEGDPTEHVFGRLRIKLFSPLLRMGFRHAAVVQAISTYLGRWARAQGFTGPLEILPNGVDRGTFSKERTLQEIQIIQENKFGKKNGDVILITTSRLVYKNAIDDVIKALPLLQTTNVRFVVLGIGSDEVKLKSLAKKLRVEDRVLFLGYEGYSGLPLYLHAADIFVRPSRSEGMGNSFIEAMAAGLPVIATQEGGIADFLFDPKRNPDKSPTGWAVDKNSPDQIAAAVQEILRNPEQTKKVVENAKSMVEEKYDWDLIAKDMREKVFARVL